MDLREEGEAEVSSLFIRLRNWALVRLAGSSPVVINARVERLALQPSRHAYVHGCILGPFGAGAPDATVYVHGETQEATFKEVEILPSDYGIWSGKVHADRRQ